MKNNLPRIGDAKIVITYNNKTGFTVSHGQGGETLAHLPAEKCKGSEWDQLWIVINRLTGQK